MFKIIVIALTLAFCSGPALAETAKGDQPKKGRSYEDCQKRMQAAGLTGMAAPQGRRGGNPTDPNAKGWMAQCMRGEI
jgi:hypothetical protein